MVFKKVEGFDNLEMDYISNFSGGYISRNKNLFTYTILYHFYQINAIQLIIFFRFFLIMIAM